MKMPVNGFWDNHSTCLPPPMDGDEWGDVGRLPQRRCPTKSDSWAAPPLRSGRQHTRSGGGMGVVKARSSQAAGTAKGVKVVPCSTPPVPEMQKKDQIQVRRRLGSPKIQRSKHTYFYPLFSKRLFFGLGAGSRELLVPRDGVPPASDIDVGRGFFNNPGGWGGRGYGQTHPPLGG